MIVSLYMHDLAILWAPAHGCYFLILKIFSLHFAVNELELKITDLYASYTWTSESKNITANGEKTT